MMMPQSWLNLLLSVFILRLGIDLIQGFFLQPSDHFKSRKRSNFLFPQILKYVSLTIFMQPVFELMMYGAFLTLYLFSVLPLSRWHHMFSWACLKIQLCCQLCFLPLGRLLQRWILLLCIIFC